MNVCADKKILLITFLIVSIVLPIVQNQSQNQMDEQETVRQREYNTRDTNKMNYQNVQSYTIKSQGVDSFYITPQVDQQVKCELYVYWKQANIFISSQYRIGEEVRVLIFQDEQRILYDNIFYMVNGFSFNVKKGSSYQIRFLTSGNINKLISLTITKMLDPTKPLIDSNDLVKTQNKISTIHNQISAFFAISQRNYIMQQKLTEQVLKYTQIYMGYQIVQIFLVLVITILQTMFVTKVLNNNSIV